MNGLLLPTFSLPSFVATEESLEKKRSTNWRFSRPAALHYYPSGTRINIYSGMISGKSSSKLREAAFCSIILIMKGGAKKNPTEVLVKYRGLHSKGGGVLLTTT